MINYKAFETEEEWKAFRANFFTASEVHRLMTEPKKKDEVLSVGAKTYILERTAETLAPVEPNYYNSAMEHGNETEPRAAMKMAEGLGLTVDDDAFIYTSVGGWIFFYDDEFDLGGTPDIIVKSLKLCGEIKCPMSKTHLEYLMLETAEDVKIALPKYYGQMQTNMYLTQTDNCIFGSFDDRFYDETLHSHEIVIPYDAEYVERLLNKLKHAKAYKEEILEKLKPQLVTS